MYSLRVWVLKSLWGMLGMHKYEAGGGGRAMSPFVTTKGWGSRIHVDMDKRFVQNQESLRKYFFA